MTSDASFLTLESVLESQSQKSEDYHQTTFRIYAFSQIFFFVYYVTVVFAGLPQWIAGVVSQDRSYSIVSVGFTTTILFVIHFLLWMPISWYSETIERSYQFSQNTTNKWIKDRVKIFLILYILFIIFAEAVYAGIDRLGSDWWIFASVVSIILLILFLFISPILLSIFTKLESFPQNEIRTRVENLATDMGVKYKDIYLWKMSQQTSKANAAVVGFGSSIRIVLGDNLVREFTPDEIDVVMTHEIGHYIHLDVYRYLVYYSVFFVIMYYIIEQVFQTAIDIFNFHSRSDPGSVGFLILSLMILMQIFDLLSNWYSRRREKAADILAIEKFKNLQVFESAFSRLALMNLAYPNPSKIEVLLRYTHPPITTRVQYAREMLA